MSISGRYHEYIGGCSVHGCIMICVRDIMSTFGVYHDTSVGYHEYIWGCTVHGGISIVHRGMFSTLEGTHDSCDGYNDSCGEIFGIHQGFQYESKAFID